MIDKTLMFYKILRHYINKNYICLNNKVVSTRHIDVLNCQLDKNNNNNMLLTRNSSGHKIYLVDRRCTSVMKL